MENDIGTISIA